MKSTSLEQKEAQASTGSSKAAQVVPTGSQAVGQHTGARGPWVESGAGSVRWGCQFPCGMWAVFAIPMEGSMVVRGLCLGS